MTFKETAKRGGSLLSAAAFAFALVTVVVPAQASAYTLLGSRSIEMSDSSNGATEVVHKVKFTTTNTATVGSVVIEYCENSPILGETCDAPTGFDTHAEDGDEDLYAYVPAGSNFVIDETASTDNKVVLNRTPASLTAGAYEFTLGDVGDDMGMTNPTNTNTTFYARIYTFADDDITGLDQLNDSIHAGGVALSTAAQLQLTAKVQETLTFCVWTVTNCAGGGTAVTLGDGNGVLAETNQNYTDTANYDLASNALNGVVVKLKGDVLTSGGNTISSQGAACFADSTNTGVEQFGLRVSNLGAGQSTATSVYGCSSGQHAFDTANTDTLYGQEVTKTTGATNSSTTELEFAAKAAGTTEAGICTSTLTLNATATY